MIAYLNGEYLDKEAIKISPDDRGFLFADGLYEVVRFYNGEAFKLDHHQQRLENGAKALRFNRNSFDDFSEVAHTITAKNNLTEAESSIVYFQVTRGTAPRSHAFPSQDTPLTTYAYAKEFHGHTEELQHGAGAITVPDDRWGNCHIKSIALLPNTLAHQKARDKGAIEAFFIRDGILKEGTHSNVAIVQDGRVSTAPLSNYILPGITRNTVVELCESLSIPFEERDISKEDLYKAEEIFLMGTTVEITPIVKVDDLGIGNQEPGPVCRKLQEALQELIYSYING